MAESKKNVHVGEDKEVQVHPKPVERPYSEAITDEHRAVLGQDAPVGTESAQAAVSS